MKKTIITQSFEETQKLGSDLAKNLKAGDIVALYGDLGSGKTTFVQGLAKGLGIKNKIISPTFIIMRTYKLNLNSPLSTLRSFYHVDLYRIENEKDIEGLGLLEIINNKESIVVIEWPEKIEHLLPSERINVIFNYIDDKKREITIE